MADNLKDVKTLEEVERDHILTTLARCGFWRKRCADLLGINRRTLFRKLKQYKESGFETEEKGQSFYD